MTHYMNQAAKDWLLRALEVIHQEFPAEAGNAEALQHALYEEIKALPVIDAGDDEAEAALERVRNVGLPPHGTPVVQFNRDIATISARLRAARASHTTEGDAVGAALERAAKDLPEGWIVELSVESGSAWVSLYDPDGRGIPVCCEDLGLSEQVDVVVNAARVDEAAYATRCNAPRPEPAAKPKETQEETQEETP